MTLPVVESRPLQADQTNGEDRRLSTWGWLGRQASVKLFSFAQTFGLLSFFSFYKVEAAGQAFARAEELNPRLDLNVVAQVKRVPSVLSASAVVPSRIMLGMGDGLDFANVT